MFFFFLYITRNETRYDPKRPQCFIDTVHGRTCYYPFINDHLPVYGFHLELHKTTSIERGCFKVVTAHGGD